MGRLLTFGLLAALVFGLLKYLSSPEMQISRTFSSAASAAESAKVSGVMENVSHAFNGQGLNRDDVETALRLALMQGGGWKSVVVVSTDIVVSEDRAEGSVCVSFNADEQAALQESAFEGLYEVNVTLAQEEGDWMLTSASSIKVNDEPTIQPCL